MKSHRKALTRAFTKIAKRWEDSKKTRYNLTRYGYKNARDWGRLMAANYFSPVDGRITCDTLIDLIDDANKVDKPLDQYDYDYLAEEEINAW